MAITYHLERFEFEWDATKAQSNSKKHRVTFEEAAEVFLDPFHVVGDASANRQEREFAWDIQSPNGCFWLSILNEVRKLELFLPVLLLVLSRGYMSNLDEEFELGENLELRVRPRESETVSIQIPKDTLESLKKVAAQRDMPLEALLKFYIGKCLRQDLSQLFVSQVLDSTAKVLARYHYSEDEVAQILQEIRLEPK